MTFITLTLNPALDMNVSLSAPLVTDGLNRSDAASFSPGGKGINVSRALRALGVDSDAVCILGGFTGAKVKNRLAEEGVRVRAISTTAETRLNLSIVTPDGQQCEINNPPGCSGGNTAIRPAEETAELLLKVRLMLRRLIEQSGGEPTAVILAGSIPPDMPKNAYAMLIEMCRRLGALTVCDCDGDALRYALSAHPDYIKPNLSELSGLTERRLTPEQIPAAAAEICVTTGGDTAVLATAGEHGAYLCRGQEQFSAPGARVERVRTLKGAGDTFLAAFLAAHYNQGMKERAALKYAAVAAAKKIETPGGAYPDLR